MTETAILPGSPPVIVTGENTALAAAKAALATTEADRSETEADRAEAAADDLLPSIGDRIRQSDWYYLPNTTGGATTSGLKTTIPSGQTGNNAILYGYWDIPGEEWVGKTVEITTVYQTSATFNRAPDRLKLLVGLTAGGSADRSTSITGVSINVSGAKITVVGSYVIQGDEFRLIWGPQLNSVGAAAGDETIRLQSWTPKFSAVPAGETVFTENTEERWDRHVPAPWIMRYANGARNGLHQEKVTVSPGGGADFTDPVAALVAANALQPYEGKRVLLECGPGDMDYTSELQPGNFVDIIGTGSRGPNRSLLRFFQDDAATTSKIDTDSAIRLQYHTRLQGLAIWAKNARYAIHPEIPLVGRANRPVWEILDCDVRHFAKTSSNGARDANTRNAIGSGTGSGYTFITRGNNLWSETGAGFAWHNSVSQAEPSLIDVSGNRIYGGGGTAMAFVAYGSECADTVRYSGNALTGIVGLAILGAGDVEETRVIGSGNTPHAITSTGDYLPEITDEEKALANNSGNAIAAGDVLAFDGSANAVRKMTSADAGSLFAGIALEAIANGGWGRVKVKGWMHLDHIKKSGIVASFTGAISGNTLTVTAISTGTIEVGSEITGGTTSARTFVAALGTGSGGTGTYTVSGEPQTVASGVKTAGAPLGSTFSVGATAGQIGKGGSQGILRAVSNDTVEVA